MILVSTANSWQAYSWWLDDQKDPFFARTVDIHRKPGYDPVELNLDMATRSTPLDATLVEASHGAPVESDQQRGLLLTSAPRARSATSTSASWYWISFNRPKPSWSFSLEEFR